MRLTIPLTFAATASILNQVQVQAASSSSSSSSVYLMPASQDVGAVPQSISNSEFASVLAHHLDVADHKLGHFLAKDSRLWSWLPSTSRRPSDTVAQLFQQPNPNDDLNLVLHVKGTQVIHGLPSTLSQTHSISKSAPPQAFDALLRTFSSSLDSISHGPLSVFNQAKDWLQGDASDKVVETEMGKANVDQWDFADESFSSLHSELSHLSDFFSSAIDSTSSRVESLTISGLLPIIDDHGSTSDEYQGALDSLSTILSGGIQSVQSHSGKAQNLKIALILSPPDEMSVSKRSSLEDAEDEDLVKRYFEPRQYQAAQPSSLIGSEKNKEEPKSDRELIRSCFKSQKELESASADCSGNGKGKETQIGGEMCWRCSCNSSWAGESCSRKDVSAQFLLLGGSGLVLVMVALGSLYVLAAEGSRELPGVLAGIQVPTLTRN